MYVVPKGHQYACHQECPHLKHPLCSGLLPGRKSTASVSGKPRQRPHKEDEEVFFAFCLPMFLAVVESHGDSPNQYFLIKKIFVIRILLMLFFLILLGLLSNKPPSKVNRLFSLPIPSFIYSFHKHRPCYERVRS